MRAFLLQRHCPWASVDPDELLYPSTEVHYLALDPRPIIVEVPRATPYDGLSVPWGARNLISPLRTPARMAGLPHDGGYKRIARVWLVLADAILPCEYPNRQWWDDLFHALCLGRLSPAKAAAAYVAVRAGGWYPWIREPRKYTAWETDQLTLCDYAHIPRPTDPEQVPDTIIARARELIRIHDA